MFELQQPLVPEATADFKSIRYHPVYCAVCLNLNPETAFSCVGIRPDVIVQEPAHLKYQTSNKDFYALPQEAPAWAGISRLDGGAWQAHALVQDIFVRAKEGCQTCQMLERSIRGVADGKIDVDTSDVAIDFTFCIGHVFRAGLGRLSPIADDEDADMFFIEPQAREWAEWYFVFEIYTVPGQKSPWPTIGPRMTYLDPYNTMIPWEGGEAGHVPQNPDTPALYDLVNHWIHKCRNNHPACNSTEESVLPSRVVDIGTATDNSNIRLVRGEGRKSKYIALSHCWGTSRIITTTGTTLDQWMRNIPYDQLSHTFQDAVKIVRKLGMRYVWIDSLCIIQDSKEDWEIEAANMANIYQNSFLVLAATASSDGAGGCLFPRNPTTEINGIGPDGDPFSLYVRKMCSHDIFSWNVPRGGSANHSNEHGARYTLTNPLFGRAWCFQERLLAKRMLHFTKHELVWECLTELNCECGALDGFTGDPLLLPKGLASKAQPKPTQLTASQAPARHEGTEQDLQKHLDLWHALASQYSQKAITYATDILPAISALASRFSLSLSSGLSTGSYLAGHFAAGLPGTLLWKALAPKESRARFLPTSSTTPSSSTSTSISASTYPTPYLAPSWSWPSIVSLGIDWLRQGYTRTSLITILSAECTPASTSYAFGAVVSGSIRLRGTLLEGVLCTAEKSKTKPVGADLDGDVNGDEPEDYWIEYQGRTHWMQQDDVQRTRAAYAGTGGAARVVHCLRFCFDVMDSTTGGGWERAIVLTKVDRDEAGRLGYGEGEEVFRRVGILEMCPDDDEWVEAREMREIVLI